MPTKRNSAEINRVIAVHDISCFGKSSLTVVLPVMSAMGLEVIPLPTALLSTHTGIKGATFLPLDSEMVKIKDHFSSLNLELSCIYSGFLGSAEQIKTVLELFKEYPNALKAVDPVMGDNGKKYKTYTDEMCSQMASLVRKADIITPNYTEASILLGIPFEEFPTLEKVKETALKLSELGPKTVVITGIRSGKTITNVAYSKEFGFFESTVNYEGEHFDGTGDLFSSVFFGEILNSKPISEALDTASEFVKDVILLTLSLKNGKNILFEPLLYKLNSPEK